MRRKGGGPGDYRGESEREPATATNGEEAEHLSNVVMEECGDAPEEHGERTSCHQDRKDRAADRITYRRDQQ